MKVTREDISVDRAQLIIQAVAVVLITWIIAGDREFMTSLDLEAFCVFFLPIFSLYIVLFNTWVEAFREIEVNAEGVNVRLWKYSKKYCWEELTEKQLARVKWYAYKEVVILSRRKTHRPKWYDPQCYGIMCCPFSYMVIHLKDESSGKRRQIYTIDKKEFLENLEKWNVKLEDGGYVRFFGQIVVK